MIDLLQIASNVGHRALQQCVTFVTDAPKPVYVINIFTNCVVCIYILFIAHNEECKQWQHEKHD